MTKTQEIQKQITNNSLKLIGIIGCMLIPITLLTLAGREFCEKNIFLVGGMIMIELAGISLLFADVLPEKDRLAKEMMNEYFKNTLVVEIEERKVETKPEKTPFKLFEEAIKIINLTPHDIHYGEMIEDHFSAEFMVMQTFEKSDKPARVKAETNFVGYATTHKEWHTGIRITESTFGEVYDLPEPVEGTFYIVSRMVLSACPHRNDLLVPNEIVRGADGKEKGCQSFAIK